MSRTPRTRFAIVSMAAVAALAVTACGGDDDDSEPDATEASADTDAADETTATEISPTDTATEADDTTGDTTSGTSGGEVGSQEDYAAIISDQLADEMDDDGVATCLGEALVSDDVYAAIEEAGLTTDAFESSGFSGLGLTEAQIEGIPAEVAGCGTLVDQMSTDDAEKACIEDTFENEQLAELLTFLAFELEPSAELEALNSTMQECINGATTTTS